MREIKFRAWNTMDKVMVYDLNSPIIHHGILKHEKEDILMQYTNLKDKNGKEIYEGDVVKANKANTFQYANADYKGIGGDYEILFFDGSYYLKGLQNLTEWVIKHMDLEIIGNIYETPELLNGTIEANKKTGLTDKGEQE